MQIIQNFILGGIIVSVVSYLATHVNPIMAAIIWSFPLSLLPAIYTMKNDGKSNDIISRFAFQSAFSIILLFIAIFSISYFIKKKYSIIESIIYSGIIWLLSSVIYYIIMTNLK